MSSDRQLDPSDIEQRAKSVLRKIHTIHISSTNVDAQKKGIALMVRAVCSANSGESPLHIECSFDMLATNSYHQSRETQQLQLRLRLLLVDEPCHLLLNLL